MRMLLLAAALALFAPSAALAQDEPKAEKKTSSSSEPEGRRSVGFASSWGVVGMRDLIDARVPSLLNVRGTIRFDNESTNVDSSSVQHSVDVYSADLIAGASALGLLDAGVRLPLEVRVEKDDLHGGPSHRITANGVGDAVLTGKVGFTLGPWIALGPYLTLHWNTGSRSLEKTNELHVGGCATASFLDDRIAAFLNVTSVSYDGGKWAIGYRLGAAVVPYASPVVLLRVFAYLDGKDYAGKRVQGQDARLVGGVQALLLELVTLEVSFGFKLVAGDLPKFVHDVGTYGLDVGAGVSFLF